MMGGDRSTESAEEMMGGAGLLSSHEPLRFPLQGSVRTGTEELWDMWCCSKVAVWTQKGPGWRVCTHPGGICFTQT